VNLEGSCAGESAIYPVRTVVKCAPLGISFGRVTV
jgi:hypothetical protein